MPGVTGSSDALTLHWHKTWTPHPPDLGSTEPCAERLGAEPPAPARAEGEEGRGSRSSPLLGGFLPVQAWGPLPVRFGDCGPHQGVGAAVFLTQRYRLVELE